MNKFRGLLTVLFLSFSIFAFSQTKDEAGNALNDGIKFAKNGDISAAIQSYNSCVDFCNSIGAEGDELKSKAQGQLISLHYKEGISFYKGKKFADAISKFEISAKIAKETGDNKAVKKANNMIPKIYYSKGMTLLKNKDFINALASFNKSIKLSPAYTKAYYGNVLVYKYQDDADNIILATNKIMEIGKEDDKYVNKAKSVTHKYFLATGTEALKKMNYSDAIKYLNLSMDYGTANADTYYYLALANNGLKKWDDAVSFANKAIEIKEGGKSDIYFVLGKALEGKVDNAAACNAFKKVTDGPNVDAAKYQIEHILKCN
ncbi:MAG: hypothetical protein K8R41_11870 [Bacteroidales bacterium]|nr:hypothetical protein [Bacteroidales bacterium]